MRAKLDETSAVNKAKIAKDEEHREDPLLRVARRQLEPTPSTPAPEAEPSEVALGAEQPETDSFDSEF